MPPKRMRRRAQECGVRRLTCLPACFHAPPQLLSLRLPVAILSLLRFRHRINSIMPPFERLATVEVQLIMHHCDTIDLLSLVHCSRHTLVAASQAFAWRGATTLVQVRMRSPADAATQENQLALRNRSPLLRHAPISFHWLVTPEQDGTAVFDSLRAVRHTRELSVLRDLNWNDHYADTPEPSVLLGGQWSQLLTSPSMAGLTSLSTGDLSIVELSADDAAAPLLLCRSLRRLSLSHPASYYERLGDVLAHADLASLEELEIAHWPMNMLPSFIRDCSVILANLQRLRSLTLRRRGFTDDWVLRRVLQALQEHTALVRFELDLEHSAATHLLPSVEMMREFLIAHPHLHMVFHTPRSRVVSAGNWTATPAQWRSIHIGWQQLAEEEERFTLVHARFPVPWWKQQLVACFHRMHWDPISRRHANMLLVFCSFHLLVFAWNMLSGDRGEAPVPPSEL